MESPLLNVSSNHQVYIYIYIYVYLYVCMQAEQLEGLQKRLRESHDEKFNLVLAGVINGLLKGYEDWVTLITLITLIT